MDEAHMRRIAREGLSAVPAEQLSNVADWCWDWCEASGDGRYCSLARTFWAMNSWWAEHSMVPDGLLSEIEHLIVSDLGAVLDADENATGASLARHLRQKVTALLLPPAEWPP